MRRQCCLILIDELYEQLWIRLQFFIAEDNEAADLDPCNFVAEGRLYFKL